MTSQVVREVGHVTRSVMHRQQFEKLMTSTISIGLMSFHLVACWLARVQVIRFISVTLLLV